MDDMNKLQRSRTMSRIRSSETSPEKNLRSLLHREGYRFRKNVRSLPGRPDIAFAKYKTAVFVNGCFWHCHPFCRKAVIPKSNEQYWISKLNANVTRDKLNKKALRRLGWKTITVWECELKADPKSAVNRIKALFKRA